MPLPEPDEPREPLHLRRIEVRGWRRRDGRYEIEGRLVDTKSEPIRITTSGRELRAGDALHDMTVRLVVDEDLLILDAIAVTDASPHAICPQAAASVAVLVGERIGPGFNRRVRDKLSGARGCTHITELIGPVASTAVQTLSQVRMARPAQRDASGRPLKIDSCYAYDRRREVVRANWPEFHQPDGS